MKREWRRILKYWGKLPEWKEGEAGIERNGKAKSEMWGL